MSPLAKRIIVLFMAWVLFVMIVLQLYDNLRGKGVQAGRAVAVPTAAASTGPDQGVQKLADLQACVANNPQNLQCTTDLANLYYEAGQYGQAQVNYERAVALSPHDPELLLKLAGTYIFQQDFEQAVTTLRQAATLSPQSPEIHLLLGLSLSRLDPPRTSEAVAEWRQVVALAPGTRWATQASEYIAAAEQ